MYNGARTPTHIQHWCLASTANVTHEAISEKGGTFAKLPSGYEIVLIFYFAQFVVQFEMKYVIDPPTSVLRTDEDFKDRVSFVFASTRGIRFVVLTGDETASGQREEYAASSVRSKELERQTTFKYKDSRECIDASGGSRS